MSPAHAAKEMPHYGRLGALSWLHFLNDGAANYLPGVLPAVLLAHQLDRGLAGAVMTALLAGQMLQPATGWLADHLGGRSLVIAGVLGTSLGGACLGLAPSTETLIALLVVMGITNSLFHPQAIAAARRVGGPRQGFSMALFLVGGEVGRGIWPLLASLVVVSVGLRGLWLLTIPALVCVPMLWRQVPLLAPRADDARPIDWRAHRGPAVRLVAFSLLRAFAVFGTTTFLPLLWQSRGHSLVAGAGTISVMLVVGMVGNVGGGHLADRVGTRRVLIGSSVAAALLLAAFLLYHGILLWLLLGALGMTLFATLPLSIVIAQTLFPENRSFGAGLALGLSNGLGALALIPLGPLAVRLGPAAALWCLVAALLLAAVIGIGIRAPTSAR